MSFRLEFIMYGFFKGNSANAIQSQGYAEVFSSSHKKKKNPLNTFGEKKSTLILSFE